MAADAIETANSAMPSAPAAGDEPRRLAKDRGPLVERRERRFGLGDELREPRTRRHHAVERYESRLALCGVLTGRLADGCSFALDIEEIVGDLEGLADRAAVEHEKATLVRGRAAEHGPHVDSSRKQRAGLHGLEFQNATLAAGHRPPVRRE